MGKSLGAIAHVGQELDDHLLSPLVESSKTEGPGRRYFVWSYIPKEDRLRLKGERRGLSEGLKTAWRRHLRKTYEYDGWFEIG